MKINSSRNVCMVSPRATTNNTVISTDLTDSSVIKRSLMIKPAGFTGTSSIDDRDSAPINDGKQRKNTRNRYVQAYVYHTYIICISYVYYSGRSE